MTHFVFFSNSIATPVLRQLLFSTCLSSLLSRFWAIQLDSLCCSLCLFWENSTHSKKKQKQTNKQKKCHDDFFFFFFGKVIGLQHVNLLKWNPTVSVFHGVTEIIFWWIIQNSYYMQSLQIIDKFDSCSLIVFLTMAYIFIKLIRNGKSFHRLSTFYYHDLAIILDETFVELFTF